MHYFPPVKACFKAGFFIHPICAQLFIIPGDILKIFNPGILAVIFNEPGSWFTVTFKCFLYLYKNLSLK